MRDDPASLSRGVVVPPASGTASLMSAVPWASRRRLKGTGSLAAWCDLWWDERFDAAHAEVDALLGRLGRDVSTLDGGDEKANVQALADASERYETATVQFGQAKSVPELTVVRSIILEGLQSTRAVRTRLGFDPALTRPPPSPRHLMDSRPTSTRGPMWPIAGSGQQLVLAPPAGCSGWSAGRSWVVSSAAASSEVAAGGPTVVAGAATEATARTVSRTAIAAPSLRGCNVAACHQGPTWSARLSKGWASRRRRTGPASSR